MSKYDLKEIIDMINNVEEDDKMIKSYYNDKNCFKRFYDRNEAIRVYVATQNGKATGNCVEENLLHYRELKKQGFNPKMYQANIMNSVLTRWIFHQFITITINGKKYMESKSNGRHIRVPYYDWAKTHQFKNKRQVYDNPQIYNFKNGGQVTNFN
tara:strand:+ start:327 stop:791 length:465 start_codon:yes stop_codon:yes gene_type:complete